MAKGFGGRMPGMGGGMNMNMLKQAQKMQQDMMKMQQELQEKEYQAAAGGGVVSATVNGKQEPGHRPGGRGPRGRGDAPRHDRGRRERGHALRRRGRRRDHVQAHRRPGPALLREKFIIAQDRQTRDHGPDGLCI